MDSDAVALGARLLFHALEDVVGGEDAEFAGFAEVGEGLSLVAHAEVGDSTVEKG